ncbi:transcriptional regulator, ArsR family [Nitrosomonas sp. Nm51]|uniref:ArsR/SmtB family transcription factor n=1 Tax=Nitrosomonas sp. Nm51 TaxID=133720 RepID=UPI0008C0050D|nr:metalloregulator ArsR/SmtB family transcription factor [Nitrosomonas sp. Nm51]SER80751.1 transcriptional regulator, ArsR family [Nitrosomonas sp. Nm51]
MDRFAALAEPNRRRMIEIIAAQGEIAASDISHQFDISPSAVSQHLKVLREAELVKMEKRAQQRIYSINPYGIDEMWEWLSQMRKFWNDRFDALDALLLTEHDTLKGNNDEHNTD